MEDTYNLPMWRKVLIGVFSLAIAICSILLGNINSIIKYDYVGEWRDVHWLDGESHIDNITNRDNDGNCLDDGWVNIGSHYWYSQSLRDVDIDSDFGELVRWYTYRIDDSDSPYYGESASLRVYDISSKCEELGVDTVTFYQQTKDSLVNGGKSRWKEASAFSPLKAISTDAYLQITFDNDTNAIAVCHDDFTIFANDRVYLFRFSNDEYKTFNKEIAYSFNKRCLSIIKDFDFQSYQQWKIDYAKYELELKQKNYWEKNIYVFIIVFGLVVFCLAIRRNGDSNTLVKYLAWYAIVGFLVYFSFCFLNGLMDDNPMQYYDSIIVLIVYFSSVVVLAAMESFLAKRSDEDYNPYCLIPEWLLRRLDFTNDVCKRLVLIFWAYPLFFVVPCPVVGAFFMVFYILPVSLLLSIICCAVWIWNGRKKKEESQDENSKPQLYCRYCGNIIDADSEYCRYCGKKL